MSDQPMAECFSVVLDLHQALGLPPLNGSVGVYTAGPWTIRLNGDSVEQTGVPPFHAAIEFNGFPAGIMSPYGGVIAAGELANEDSFIEAVQQAAKKARGES